MRRERKNCVLLEGLLFEDPQTWDWEQDPNHPMNKSLPPAQPPQQRVYGVDKKTSAQRPAGSPVPEKIGSGAKPPPFQPGPPQAPAKKETGGEWAQGTNSLPAKEKSSQEDFYATLEISINHISKVSARLEGVSTPRSHFLAHKEILAAIQNVYRDLDKASTTPKVKDTCMAMQQDLGGALKTLNAATREAPPKPLTPPKKVS